MGKKQLDRKTIISIRRDCNPKKAFGPNILHRDLIDKSYLEAVELFNKRISGWYFNIVQSMPYKIEHYNFPVIIFCCIIIDLLSQYVYGLPVHKEESYKQFFRDYLKKFNRKIDPPIISCRFREKNWHEEIIHDFADAFYHCFRCGVVHSGRILEYGRINESFPEEIIKLEKWGKNSREIHVHTTGLLAELKNIFNNYIEKLRNHDPELMKNFIDKFEIEYGITIKR